MIRAVLDTNVYVSGILFNGTPRDVLGLAIRGKIDVFISPAILFELKEVLARKKFGFPQEHVDFIIREIESITIPVIPSKRHSVVARDSDDNSIIDCAMEARAEYIVTGDNDLLSLKKYKRVGIISPAEFIIACQHHRAGDE